MVKAKGKKTTNKAKIDAQKEVQRQLIEQELEQESSSSTPTSTESTDSFVSFYEAEEEEELDELDYDIFDTDNESLDDEDPEYVKRKTLMEQINLFEILGDITDVDNISEDISVLSKRIEPDILEEDEVEKDIGKFFDPLTGRDLSEESIFEDQIEEIDKKHTETSSESLILQDVMDLEDEKKSVLEVDNTLEAFLESQKKPEAAEVEEIDFQVLLYEEEIKLMRNNTKEFLAELINKVVDLAEYLSPEKFLQQNLDKRKLLTELVKSLEIYSVEKSKCAFLNRQIVTHFRRKKMFRVITEDNPKTLSREKEKLEKAKEHLDQTLIKETKLISKTAQLQQDLRKEYDKLRQEAETQIQMFEDQVKKHLCRESRPKLNGEVDRLLLYMQKYRQEVNNVRFSLFLQQHTEAHLGNLIYQMEDLGNGLNMKSFGTLQAENQALEKKIEERNTDLNKLYLRCHNNVHTLAHYKENQKMLYSSIKIQRQILNNLTDNRLNLRENLFSLKLQRNGLHGKIKKLSVQGGLLDKPDLMMDYDNTVQLLEETKERVDYLRKTLLEIQRKIDLIVERGTNEKF